MVMMGSLSQFCLVTEDQKTDLLYELIFSSTFPVLVQHNTLSIPNDLNLAFRTSLYLYTVAIDFCNRLVYRKFRQPLKRGSYPSSCFHLPHSSLFPILPTCRGQVIIKLYQKISPNTVLQLSAVFWLGSQHPPLPL